MAHPQSASAALFREIANLGQVFSAKRKRKRVGSQMREYVARAETVLPRAGNSEPFTTESSGINQVPNPAFLSAGDPDSLPLETGSLGISREATSAEVPDRRDADGVRTDLIIASTQRHPLRCNVQHL